MKPRITQLWCWLVLFSLAASLQLTLGYYDPSAQRWINRDPIEERGGLNQYSLVRNGSVADVDFFGLAVGTGPVQFPFPNGPGDNCYTYACNRPGGPKYPGRTTPYPPGTATCANVVAGLLNDHPEANSPMGCDQSCAPGMHRIAVFASGDDFHFHRQDSDGRTSHKRGNAPPNRLPFDFDRDPFYEDFCGEFCVND